MWVISVMEWSNAGILEVSFSELSGLEFFLSGRGGDNMVVCMLA